MKKNRSFIVTLQFYGNPKEIQKNEVFKAAMGDLRRMFACTSIMYSDEVYVMDYDDIPTDGFPPLLKGVSKNEK